jgi:hypothetical protein
MSASDLVTDGSIVLRTLARPTVGLSALSERPRAAVALLLSTFLALAAAAAVIPRTDYGGGDTDAKPADGQPPPDPTEYERDQAASAARKLGELGDWAEAALLPSLLAACAAGLLVAGFRVAGARTSFRPALAVAAHGTVPLWLARLLAVPAALSHGHVPRAEVAGLLPASAAAFLPPGAPPPLVGALGAIDLFGLWAAWLVALGMARATGASRLRSFAVTFALYLAYVALARVALPSLLAGPGAPPR